MTTYVAGVGPGLFALACVAAVGLVATLVTCFARPGLGVVVAAASAALVLLVFGFIAASPVASPVSTPATTTTRVLEPALPDTIEDTLLPLRVSLVLLAALGTLAGAVYYNVVLALSAPPFEAATHVACRRKRLTELHPAWMQ
jgi:hypothetical protein